MKFLLLGMAVLLALVATIPFMDTAVAQESEQASDGEEEYKDGSHEGKSCPFKNKTASVSTGFNT
jgi:hypothetical protein